MSEKKDSNFKPLLYLYDAFGWIPTIRGALSLDLLNNSNNMWGDVDKHAVQFVDYNGCNSERFIVASSFHNVSDSKYGDDYVRTFRYFFYGNIRGYINGCDIRNSIEKELTENEINLLNDFNFTDSALLGRLIIVIEETSTISDLEVRIIRTIEDLLSIKRIYNKSYSINADSLEILQTSRKKMRLRWDEIVSDINDIKNENKIQFHFDVFMTRDGVLLLKDSTDERSKSKYFKDDTPSDYTKNIPIHRVFKTAMNFIKYLFHLNYHHEEDNDTFLPASNLHPYRQNHDFSRVIKHQMDAFLNPVVKTRRNLNKKFGIDPIGIILYAKSFIYACKNNELIDDVNSKRHLDYLAILENDHNHLTRHKKSLLNSIATQQNSFFIITSVLAFIVAFLKVMESGMRISGTDNNFFADQQWYATVLFIVALGLLGYIIWFCTTYGIRRREFMRDPIKENANRLKRFCFFKNSNLIAGRLSYPFQFYIWTQNNWHKLLNRLLKNSDEVSIASQNAIQYIKLLVWIIFTSASVALIWKILFES